MIFRLGPAKFITIEPHPRKPPIVVRAVDRPDFRFHRLAITGPVMVEALDEEDLLLWTIEEVEGHA